MSNSHRGNLGIRAAVLMKQGLSISFSQSRQTSYIFFCSVEERLEEALGHELIPFARPHVLASSQPRVLFKTRATVQEV